jgi:2-hydroxychromene-2-carboxylate isomerase
MTGGLEKVVDYYYVLTSPWTYLGGPRFEAMTRRHGVRVNHKPIDLGRIFPLSGGLPLAKRAPQRQAYRLEELQRWRRRLDMPLNLHPKYFPASDTLAALVVVAAARDGADAGALANAFLRAVWAEERNIADPETVAAIVAENGLNATVLLRAAETDAVKAAYEANTEEAIARNVFGAPTYIYRGAMFWGQDRLDFLEEAFAEPN